MTVLRCTAKLLKAMKATPVESPLAPSNRLGEWTANLIRYGRKAYVLAANENTRLGLMIDAAPYAGIPQRFADQLHRSLLALGVAQEQAEVEAAASRPTAFARSNSASVLATINRYGLDMEAHHHFNDESTSEGFSRRLLHTLVLRPAHIGSPADRVREVFGLPPSNWRSQTRPWPQAPAADEDATGPQSNPTVGTPRAAAVADPGAALSPTELDALNAFLQQPGRRERTMDPAMLEGYAAALIVAPEMVLPSDWLPWVWDIDAGRAPAGFATAAQAQRIYSLVMRLYNGVARAFMAEPVRFTPLYQREARWDARRWCQGFLIGLDFDEALWLELMDKELAWFTPFVMLGEDEEIPAEEFESGNVERWKAVIPTRLVQMRDHWRRQKEVPALVRRAEPKVGRNEACPCGSGRKFKKCCGAAPTLH